MVLQGRGKSMPGIVFAILTICFALGNFDVGLQPYGIAVWVRPLFSLMGIAGAIMLLAGVSWWRVFLPLWCLLQTWVIATDASGRWFFQGLFAGVTYSQSSSVNGVVTSFQENGVNFAGLVLFGILSFIIAYRLHPDTRRGITARQQKTAGVLVAIFLFIATAVVLAHRVQTANASFIQGQMPGTAPRSKLIPI